MWFIGVEVEQETSAPPPKKHPGSAPVFMAVAEDKEPEISLATMSIMSGYKDKMNS